MSEPVGGYLSEAEFDRLRHWLVNYGLPDVPDDPQQSEILALMPRVTLSQAQEITLNLGLWYRDGQFYYPGYTEADGDFAAAVAKYGPPIQHPDEPETFTLP
jgi:hypothetical protein